jgi:hypothetical protein
MSAFRAAVMTTRPRFVVTFVPAPGINGVRALRLLLKSARRRFGLIAVGAYEDAPTNVADAFEQLRRDVQTRLRERRSS